MKNKIIIAAVVAVVGLGVGLLIANPFGGDNLTPATNSSDNYTPDENGPPNPNEPAINSTWISPGKVIVDNFYPGAKVEYELQIHNGNDHEAVFSVGYRYPDHTKEGYNNPCPDVPSWVHISDKLPALSPYETKVVKISLIMPSYATPPSEKWEFWIGVIDRSQTGMIQTELCCRWLITMQ